MTTQVESLINRFEDRIDDAIYGITNMKTNTMVVDQATIREMLYKNDLEDKFPMLCKSKTPFLTHREYDMGECWIVVRDEQNIPIAVACFNGDDDDEMEVDGLEVSTDYHHQGLGKVMVELLHTIVSEVGITSITLEAFDLDSIKFWKSMGYEQADGCSYFLEKKF